MEPTYNPVTSKDDDGEPDIRHVEPSIAGRVLDIDFISEISYLWERDDIRGSREELDVEIVQIAEVRVGYVPHQTESLFFVLPFSHSFSL